MPKRNDKRDTAKAEYIKRRRSGEKVNLKDLAEKLGVTYGTVRNWKRIDQWDDAVERKRGGQPGNKNSRGKRNAKGNPGGGAPNGNTNAEKDGAYSTVHLERLSQEERDWLDQMPTGANENNIYELKLLRMENILKVFLMAFPEWLACIFMVVGLVVTALAAVRLGYGLVVAKTVYKWIVNAEEKFGAGAGAEKKAHVIAVLRGYTPDWLDWVINERTLDWIVQLVFDFTKKKLEDYMAKKSAETTTVAHFGNVGENKRND